MATHYTKDFKQQIVNIYNQGEYTYKALADKYGIAPSTVREWVLRYNESQSFDIDATRTDEEKELIQLRKKVKQLEMENDILKQAALLLGKK